VTRRADKDVNMFEADDKAGYKRCLPGDLAINTLWAWMGAMGISPLAGIVSPDYHVYKSKGQLLPEYIGSLCRSRAFVAEVSRWSKGVWSSRLRLYPENFFEMRLPVPPHEEQRAIVQAVEGDQRKASALSETLEQSISLAKERRSALISAAVAGQIPLEEMAA
jgi:type I restriction enzyme S subunit